MSRTSPLLAALVVAVTLLGGCSSTDENIIKLPVDITSRPDRSNVEYRIVVGGGKHAVPDAGDWIYLGRTPYAGKAKLSKKVLEKKNTTVEFRVSQRDHRAAVQSIETKALDLDAGVRFRAELTPLWSDQP